MFRPPGPLPAPSARLAARIGDMESSLAKKTSKTSKSGSTAAKKKAGSAAVSTKKIAKKTAKKTAKKAAKTVTKKTAKTAAKKKTAKAATKKTAKAATKKTAAKTAKKPAVKKKPTPKPLVRAPVKKIASKKTAKKTVKKVEAKKPAATGKAGEGDAARKGITIVTKKPLRKKKKITYVMPDLGAGILGGGKRRKPVIASGPKNKLSNSDPASQGEGSEETKPKAKSPFNKKKLMRFREILLRKRAELVGDVSEMEKEALLSGGSGGLSHTPSHMAEQGSDTYDQALSLNIASVDRKLIKEIDDALERIDNKTYGVCELTGDPIREERLEELPWARHSIDAARELERRSMRP